MMMAPFAGSVAYVADDKTTLVCYRVYVTLFKKLFCACEPFKMSLIIRLFEIMIPYFYGEADSLLLSFPSFSILSLPAPSQS